VLKRIVETCCECSVNCETFWGKDTMQQPSAGIDNGCKITSGRAFCRTCVEQGCRSTRHRPGDVRCTVFAERLPGHWVITLDDCEILQAGRCSRVGIMDPVIGRRSTNSRHRPACDSRHLWKIQDGYAIHRPRWLWKNGTEVFGESFTESSPT
jgi:hypothetical protein